MKINEKASRFNRKFLIYYHFFFLKLRVGLQQQHTYNYSPIFSMTLEQGRLQEKVISY